MALQINMKQEAKSAVIARKKISDEKYMLMVNLFDLNNPHESSKAPNECLEYECKHAMIEGLDIKFIPFGNDIIINDLIELDIINESDIVTITGVQNSK